LNGLPPPDQRPESHPVMDEPDLPFVIEQFKQGMEAYRAAMLSVISFSTVLVVVNATLVGYAVNQRLAGLLLIGPIFPITMIGSVMVVRRMQTPMIYFLINLEHRFGGDKFDWGMTTFVSSTISATFVEGVLAIGNIADREERMRAIDRNPVPVIGTGKGVLRAMLTTVALGQVIAAIALWQAADWRLF
jgi:hypothetical protein